jgi:ABC-type multidrug transport system ATPase subunit
VTNKIVFENVSKSYGNFKALDGINLEIPEGMFGLLGPNGAGKTTFMKILVTLLDPSEGRVLINGHDAAIITPITNIFILSSIFFIPPAHRFALFMLFTTFC